MQKNTHIRLSQIPSYAKTFGKKLKGGEVLALIGPLGSGKTTFTKTLAKQLKVKQPVTSPTFVLMHVFPARFGGKPGMLYHLDLYRTKNFRETAALGLTEVWGRPDVVTVIEWADKIEKHLPKKTIYLYFEHDEKKET